MMINTSKFSKFLMIFLVYNIIIIFKVSCSDSDTDDTKNKIVPDFEAINIDDRGDYFKYYFRTSNCLGQQKVRPKTFFQSIYNCDYMILPELNEDNNYDEYLKKIKKLKGIFQSVYDKYKNNHQSMKEKEDFYVLQFEKSYEVTKKAYDEVINYESQTAKQQSKKLQEDAINEYLTHQMPEVSKEAFNNDSSQLKYRFKNYEVYAEPTDEVYYPSNILQEEYNAVTDGYNIKKCDVALTKEEYDEVLFLYAFLGSAIHFKQSEFISAKIDLFLYVQNTLPNLSKTYTKEELITLENTTPENTKDDYRSTTYKLQNELVVNHENYMSYLVRMKISGRIGFHLDYHKHMYKTRRDYAPNVDITNGRKHTIDMDIHGTSEKHTYAELVPFNPEDI